jgi:sulfide:quinone oxidoreductase
VPPSPETSRALVAAFTERNIKFIPGRRVASIDGARKVAILDDGTEMQFDLFLGVPKHRVPSVVVDSGMAENGWIPVNPRTLETNYPGIYAVGDGANTGTPKAGVFAEGAALAVASALIARLRNGGKATEYNGFGTCYVEFGGGRIVCSASGLIRAAGRPAATPLVEMLATGSGDGVCLRPLRASSVPGG